MNEIIPIAQYFLICRELGEEPRWPGDLKAYHYTYPVSYSPSIADLTIFATTHDNCKDEAFNHVNGDVFVFKFLWEQLGKYFNVHVPSYSMVDEHKSQLDMGEWAMDKAPVWERIVAKYGGSADTFQIDAFKLMGWFLNASGDIRGPFVPSMNKARKAGWSRVDDSYSTWTRALQSYENAGFLPKHRQFHGN